MFKVTAYDGHKSIDGEFDSIKDAREFTERHRSLGRSVDVQLDYRMPSADIDEAFPSGRYGLVRGDAWRIFHDEPGHDDIPGRRVTSTFVPAAYRESVKQAHPGIDKIDLEDALVLAAEQAAVACYYEKRRQGFNPEYSLPASMADLLAWFRDLSSEEEPSPESDYEGIMVDLQRLGGFQITGDKVEYYERSSVPGVERRYTSLPGRMRRVPRQPQAE